MSQVEVVFKYNEYKASFRAELSRYNHFCAGLQLSDHHFSYGIWNSSWGEYNSIDNFSDVPKWLIAQIYKKAIQKLLPKFPDYRVMLAQIHTGETSNWSYIHNQKKELPFFNLIKANSMVLYEEMKNGKPIILEEYMINKDSLRAALSSIVVDLPAKVENAAATPPPSELTEESIKEYLNANF